jgi:hypothetical protein
MSRPFATVEEAIEEIRAGRMVVVCDDEDRENEGDLTMRGRVRDARGDQLHGARGARADLPHRSRPSAATSSGSISWRQERVGVRDGVHQVSDRGRARA